MPPSGWKKRVLSAKVKRGLLTIEIGIDTLAFATLRSDLTAAQSPPGSGPPFRINDTTEFARDVVRELLDEDEAGETMLTQLLDQAAAQAIENGSIAVSDATDDEET